MWQWDVVAFPWIASIFSGEVGNKGMTDGGRCVGGLRRGQRMDSSSRRVGGEGTRHTCTFEVGSPYCKGRPGTPAVQTPSGGMSDLSKVWCQQRDRHLRLRTEE